MSTNSQTFTCQIPSLAIIHQFVHTKNHIVSPVRLMIDASLSRVAFCSLQMCCAEAAGSPSPSLGTRQYCVVLRIIEWAARSFRGIGLLWTTSYHGKRGRFKLRPPWNDATRPCLKYPSSSMSPTLRLSDRSESVAGGQLFWSPDRLSNFLPI